METELHRAVAVVMIEVMPCYGKVPLFLNSFRSEQRNEFNEADEFAELFHLKRADGQWLSNSNSEAQGNGTAEPVAAA
uniref:Uncharacterized protein n=1 Tax=Setaria digitata TaxID=48799 RepID=A0A915PG23_9BILA